MTSIIKSSLAGAFGPYVYLVRMAVLSLMVLSVSRIALVVWNYERVDVAGNLTSIFLQGVRADLILICLWLLIPVLCVPVFAWKRWAAIWFKGTYVWCLAGLVCILFMELATPAFLMQFDARPNRLFIEYLKYPQEVLSTLWHGFRLPFVGGLLLTVLFGYGLHCLLRWPTASLTVWSPLKNLLVWPLIFMAVFMGIRSTTNHRPANPALFAITGDSMVNSLVINSGYSVLYALYNMKHEARSSEIYGKLPINEMLQLSLDWPWLKKYTFENPEYPTLHQQEAAIKRERPLNLVIVLQESMGATFVKSLGGVAVTPELEKLAGEGMWFERLYATGTRSVRGIEAVVAGYLPTPAQSVVKLSKSQNNFATLASVLKTAGYRTQFIYGGEAHFDNMRGFFTSNGFEDIVDIKKIRNPVFVGSWGASDEDLFNTAQYELDELHKTGKPFFSLIFTSSNHEPFEFPDNRIELFERPKNTANNAVKYADWAMGKFFEQAKQSSYWQDTVFLVIADHDNRVYGNNLIPVEKFQIPGLILGADISPTTVTTLSSQIDLAPTLLSLMGVSACHPMIGRDFASDSTSPGRAILQFEDYFALMEPDKLTILKPDETAFIAHYDEHKKVLTMAGSASDIEKKKALAQVQLPSYLYREGKYSSSGLCK
ncbi:MAG: sulfatase [Cellvibrio sp. 79]|nr:MAG: sulfatase [Cellvibrio sp. 79]